MAHRDNAGTDEPPELQLNAQLPSMPLDYKMRPEDFMYRPEMINLDSDDEDGQEEAPDEEDEAE